MRKFLKILASFFVIVFVIIPVAFVATHFIYGMHAEKRADAIVINPSANLISLANAYQLSIPAADQPDCNDNRYYGKGRSDKINVISTFIGWVDEAQSAESAAIRFQSQGGQQMAAVAAQDAINRWSHVARLKADMNCYDIQSARSSY